MSILEDLSVPISRFQQALKLVAGHLGDGEVILTLRTLGEQSTVFFVGGAVEPITGFESLDFERSAGLWARLVHPEDRDALFDSLRFVECGEIRSLQYRIVAKDARVRSLREDLSLLPGLPVRALGVVHDQSRELQLRDQVSGLEERLWRAQRMETFGTLAGEVAHDFNDLLTTILATAPLVAEEEGLSGVSRANLRIVEGAATRGSKLVKQMLEFSANPSASTAGVAHISTVARGLEPILARALGKDVRLSVRAEEDLWPAACDASRVEQVIFNLTMNAKEAMPEGGEITVGAMNAEIFNPLPVEGGVLPPGRYVQLVVADAGSGISAGVRERLLDSHFTTKSQSDNGLGLWTVSRIVEECGGGMTLESAVGEGTTFHVYFPCGAGVRISMESVPVQQTRGLGHGLRILILDDDAAVCGLLERSLVRDGHSVTVARSLDAWTSEGQRATPSFELIIADIELARASGVDFRGRSGALAELPAVFLVERGQEGGSRVKYLHGQGALLARPVDPEALREAIAQVTRREEAWETDLKHLAALG